MLDSETRDRVVVSGDEYPYIMLPADQVDRITARLRQGGIYHWVNDYTISMNGRPPATVINFRRGTDPKYVQRLLDEPA